MLAEPKRVADVPAPVPHLDRMVPAIINQRNKVVRLHHAINLHLGGTCVTTPSAAAGMWQCTPPGISRGANPRPIKVPVTWPRLCP